MQLQTYSIFPIRTKGRANVFLKPRYKHIGQIVIANSDWIPLKFDEFSPNSQEDIMRLLEGLPSCFVKDFDYGLGLRKDYVPIVEAVERSSSCTKLVIEGNGVTTLDNENSSFHMSSDDFLGIRKAIDRSWRENRADIELSHQEVIRHMLAGSLKGGSSPDFAGSSRPAITDSKVRRKRPSAREERNIALDVVTENTKSIAADHPERLEVLNRDIDNIMLETLIGRFERMLKDSLQEVEWQAFLNENPKILNLAFGYPITKVQDQASVGGHRLSRKGETIADFLVKTV